MEGSRSERLKQRRREEYNAKGKEVKRSAWEDKRNWIENRAAAAENAAENGRNKELFKSLARPVLLYGCDTWKITKADDEKLNSFQCQCLRRILRIRWQQGITNKRVVEMAEISDVSCEV